MNNMKRLMVGSMSTLLAVGAISFTVLAPASQAAGATPKVTCAPTKVTGRDATKIAEPTWAKTAKNYTLNFVTNCGLISMAVDAAHAPITAQAFKLFATHNYFDNTKCHRLVTSGIYILQCGDPSAKGTGGPVDLKGNRWPGYADENLPTPSSTPNKTGKLISSTHQQGKDSTGKLISYRLDTLQNADGTKSLNIYIESKNAAGKTVDTFYASAPSQPYAAGVVAMANSGPNTNGSQFFINYLDSSAGLQSSYTVLGRITNGLNIVQYVASKGIAKDGMSPIQTLAILKTYIS